MSRFTFHKTRFKGLDMIERESISDTRGFFERIFCYESLNQMLQSKAVRQINRSFTKEKGTLRGLHFQHPPYSETKIVTCLKGQVFDVAVDLRKGSPTFLQYHIALLSDENHLSCIIPDGFAHGFQTLTQDCEMLYLHTTDYSEKFEAGINAKDPYLAIEWPEPITERSGRDLNHPMLTKDFEGIDVK